MIKNNPLFFAFLFPALIDASTTLLGQDNEASPAYYFLVASPNIFITLLFISGHSWGSSSWIMKMFRENGIYNIGNQISIMLAWLILVIYFSLIAVVATHCLRIYFNRK